MRRGVLSPSGVKALAERLVERFAVQPAAIREAAAHLSGGNQQKLVAARELSREPVLLVAEQPTQGVDVDAAEGIHNRLLAARDQGRAVLVVSAELSELLAIADRILVMLDGRIVAAVAAPEADEETLGLLAAGGSAA